MEIPPIFLNWQNKYCELAFLPKVIYRLNAMLIKMPVTFFIESEENNLKIHTEPQETMNG
jgi:hypothetical protein